MVLPITVDGYPSKRRVLTLRFKRKGVMLMTISWTDLIQFVIMLIALAAFVYKVCKDIFRKK